MNTSDFVTEFDALSKYLKGFAFKLTKDVHMAEDLFQDTAFRAFNYQDKFSSNSNLRAWLCTIMKNTFINNFRGKKRQRKLLDNCVDDQMFHSEKHYIRNEGEGQLVMEDLSSFIDALDERFRAPFLMMHNGYKYEEICEELALPLGTVKSRIYMARNELKRKISLLYGGHISLN
ncbi:MAG: RNA polymerase sigma factor [Saprospiraceae bacterium]